MRFIKKIAVLLTTLFLVSCSAETNDQVQIANTLIESMQIQQQWRLVAIDGQAIDPQINSTLSISDGNKATGNLACNAFFGTLQVQENQLKIDKMGSTRKMCEDKVNAVEFIVAAVLSDWSEVSLDGESLTLLGKVHKLRYKVQH
jgi:heat shock protein HslJ